MMYHCETCGDLFKAHKRLVVDFRCQFCKHKKDVNLLGVQKDKSLDAEETAELMQGDAQSVSFTQAMQLYARRHRKTVCKKVNTITSRHWWDDLNRKSPILSFMAFCVLIAIMTPFLAFLGLGALWASLVAFQFWNGMPL